MEVFCLFVVEVKCAVEFVCAGGCFVRVGVWWRKKVKRRG